VVTVHLDGAGVDKLADAIRRIEPARVDFRPPSVTATSTATLDSNGSVKVWPSSGPPVEIKGPLQTHYSSASELLRVRVLVREKETAEASRVHYFYKPVRWEEIPAPGNTMVWDERNP
jgi:hypothetical protein